MNMYLNFYSCFIPYQMFEEQKHRMVTVANVRIMTILAMCCCATNKHKNRLHKRDTRSTMKQKMQRLQTTNEEQTQQYELLLKKTQSYNHGKQRTTKNKHNNTKSTKKKKHIAKIRAMLHRRS